MTLCWLSFRPYDVLTTTSFINVSESQSLQSVFVSLFWFPMWNRKRHISGTCRRSTKGRDQFAESESYVWKHFLSVISFQGSTFDNYLQCVFTFVNKERELSPRSVTTWKTHEYSQSQLYGQLLNTDTALLRTVWFVPGELGREKALKFSLHSTPSPPPSDTPLIWTLSMTPSCSVSVLTGFDPPPRHPINMETFYGPLMLCVLVNGVWR